VSSTLSVPLVAGNQRFDVTDPCVRNSIAKRDSQPSFRVPIGPVNSRAVARCGGNPQLTVPDILDQRHQNDLVHAGTTSSDRFEQTNQWMIRTNFVISTLRRRSYGGQELRRAQSSRCPPAFAKATAQQAVLESGGWGIGRARIATRSVAGGSDGVVECWKRRPNERSILSAVESKPAS
jgi:hypothetical protein